MMRSNVILKPRQTKFINYYISSDSPTFANCYQSALRAGYSDLTARNLTHVKPKWLSETFGNSLILEPMELKTMLSSIATDAKEPTRMRIKAIELMMRHYGMMKSAQVSERVHISLDLSGGTTPPNPERNYIDPLEAI